MYGRPGGHQRDFGGSISSARSLSPTKHDFSEETQSGRTQSDRRNEYSIDKLRQASPPSEEDEGMEEQIPTPPPHKTPTLLQKPIEPTSPPAEIKPLETSPPPIERSITPPNRLPTSTSTDSLARKRWSPTKSSWLDSALQKASEPPIPGSPPKRTSSIRPIAPAVPSGVGKWSNERTSSPNVTGLGITKSTSFTSALGGMGGRRDVAGIQLSTPKKEVLDSGFEARLAALEKKTPPRQELPRSQSLRETLQSVSSTPSPPSTKPKWSPSTSLSSRTSTKSAPDPVKERLLAARSGLARTQTKAPSFSDPLKEGILAAKEKLKVQDKPREKRENELKMSILNARKGLRRPGSREESERGESVEPESVKEESPAPREQVTTPQRKISIEKPALIEKEIVVKQEEITPTKPEVVQRKFEPSAKPTQPSFTKPEETMKPKEADTVKPKSREPLRTNVQEPIKPKPEEVKRKLTSLRALPVDRITSKIAQSVSTQKTTTPSIPREDLDFVPLVKTTSAPNTTAPKELIPPAQKVILKPVDGPKKENDSPTPQEKFIQGVATKPGEKAVSQDVSVKPTEAVKPIKQTSLPLTPKTTNLKAGPAKGLPR
jgi:hypothetical protein